MRYGIGAALLIVVLAAACAKPAKAPEGVLFKDDLAFLEAHTKVVVLDGADGQAQVAVNPDLQGRVMTSTAGGPDGLSFGWIGREAIASGVNNPHMNAFGGEDRFWLGPEGGQFSDLLQEGRPVRPRPLVDAAGRSTRGPSTSRPQDADRIHLPQGHPPRELLRERRSTSRSTGRSGCSARPRSRRWACRSRPASRWSPTPPTTASPTLGANAWTKDTGLLSIWILGMFNPSPATTIVIPFKTGPEAELGPAVNDAYFGKVPADRLVVDESEGVLFFSGDGKFRSKIGISPRRVKPFAGSYDAANGVLTVVHLTVPEGATDYVNSMWEIQEEPFAGDVVNSYNDGPAAPGPSRSARSTSSSRPRRPRPSAPGGTLTHVHTTMHFQGPDEGPRRDRPQGLRRRPRGDREGAPEEVDGRRRRRSVDRELPSLTGSRSS
ncbi:MAG: hypothetical protein MZV64_49945 [Ignavibacteriales bacterium]|nr:hypothetical protein [Ignavibacteriales bacterium]